MSTPSNCSIIGSVTVIMPDACRCSSLPPFKRRLMTVCLLAMFAVVIGLMFYTMTLTSTHDGSDAVERPTTTSFTVTMMETNTTTIKSDPTSALVSNTNIERNTSQDNIPLHTSNSDDNLYPVTLIAYNFNTFSTTEAPEGPQTQVATSTGQALPHDPYSISAVTLLHQTLSETVKFYEVACAEQTPPVYQGIVEVGDMNYTGQTSTTRVTAKENAAEQAASAIWGLKYPVPDFPPCPCTPVVDTATETPDAEVDEEWTWKDAFSSLF